MGEGSKGGEFYGRWKAKFKIGHGRKKRRRRTQIARQKKKNKQKENVEEEEDPSGLWIRDKGEEQHSNLGLSLNKHASLSKKPQELRNKQNQGKKNKSFTLHCVYNEFIPGHTVGMGLIILAFVHIPHQKDWNGDIMRLCNTWLCISCSLPGNSFSLFGILHDISSPAW